MILLVPGPEPVSYPAWICSLLIKLVPESPARFFMINHPVRTQFRILEMNSKFREVPGLCSFKTLKVRATVHDFAVSPHKDPFYTYSELNRGRGRCHRSLALHSIDDPLFVGAQMGGV